MRRKFFLFLFSALYMFTSNFINIFADDAVLGNTETTGSKASILMEMSSGTVLAGNNYDDPLPIGTLNKIMTALLVAEAVDEGNLSLDSEITASAYANSMKQAVIWLKAGEKMSAGDLIKGMIIGNANDAAVALAEAVSGSEEAFVSHMNKRASELGMNTAVFKNCTGFDEENQGASARDVAIMTRELLKHEWLYPIMISWTDTLRNGETSLVNENKLVKSFNGIVGVKAGHSEAAGSCLSLAAKRDGVCYIAVVLGADKDLRFDEAKTLVNSGFSSYKAGQPYVPLKALVPIRVTGGTKDLIRIKTDRIDSIVLKNGAFENVEINIDIPEFIAAPVAENQELGSVTFSLEGQEIYKAELLASESVDEMTFVKALSLIIKKTLKF